LGTRIGVTELILLNKLMHDAAEWRLSLSDQIYHKLHTVLSFREERSSNACPGATLLQSTKRLAFHPLPGTQYADP